MKNNQIPQSLFERLESEWRQVRAGAASSPRPAQSSAAK